MKIIIVWHLNHDIAVIRGLGSENKHIQPLVGALFGEKEQIEELWWGRCYEPVASVQIDDALPDDDALELAYRHTNHIHCSWNDIKTCPAFLQPIRYERARSSSIGDVFEIVRAKEDQEPFYVSRYGFSTMRKPIRL